MTETTELVEQSPNVSHSQRLRFLCLFFLVDEAPERFLHYPDWKG